MKPQMGQIWHMGYSVDSLDGMVRGPFLENIHGSKSSPGYSVKEMEIVRQ